MYRNGRPHVLVGVAIGLVGLTAFAGDLNPPPGAVAPTMKTLVEVEPRSAINATNTPSSATALFRISQSGSYYLAGNVVGVAGKNGIEITSFGVTVDLMGFELLGVPGSLDGVNISGGRNIVVRNGTIRAWGNEGIDALTPVSGLYEDLLVFGNGLSGSFSGMRIGPASRVVNCTADTNSQIGVYTYDGCAISGCTAHDNGQEGIAAGAGSTIIGCTALANGEAGISASGNCSVIACTATGNSIAGIQVANSHNVVSDSSADGNIGDGILANYGCTINNCSASSNAGDGIQVSADCRVIANTCSANGLGAGDGRGIHVTASDNRIEANNCTDNSWGIGVFSAGNFIARNTCSGNTIVNWDIATGNVCFVVNAATSGPISGNSGGVAPGSSDPNANFTY